MPLNVSSDHLRLDLAPRASFEESKQQMGSLDQQPASSASGIEASPSLAHHVVIVGAGFAGLSLAQSLGSTPLRVTVIDRRNYHLFQPLLYQVATAVLSPGEIAQPIRRILGRHKNITGLLGEVDDINPERKEVYVNGEAITYDTLVLATGATHGYFGHSERAQFAPGLKTLEDARRIRAQILMAFEKAEMERDPAERERLMTFAIIGGGPTGVEMAGAIAELARQALARDFHYIDPTKARILLIEAAPRILGPFPEDLSAYAERALKRLGVTLLTGKPVEDVNERGVTVGGEFIACSTVVWAAGVAASPAGQWLQVGSDRAGRVAVAPDLSVPGLDNVYVLGDLALAVGEDSKPLPGSGCPPAGPLSRQGAARTHSSSRDACPVPLPQPGQSGRRGAELGGDPLGQPQAQGLFCLAPVGHRPRLSAGGLPQPVSRDHALALDVSHLPAQRAADCGRCHPESVQRHGTGDQPSGGRAWHKPTPGCTPGPWMTG